MGFNRIEYYASPELIVKNQYANYSLPEILPVSQFALSGEWLISSEYAQPKSKSILVERFQSKDVYLVMNADVATPVKA